MADYTIIVRSDDGRGWRALDLTSGDRVLIESVQVAALEATTQFVAPSGGAFPGAPAAGELFWRTDEQKLYRYDGAAWEAAKPDDDGVAESLGGITGNPHGFLNQTDTTIAFVDGTLTFTITPVGLDFDYYYQGNRINKAASENKVIANTDGVHFIYYDATNILQDSLTPWNLGTDVPVATILWNVATATSSLGEERHSVLMDSRIHQYLHLANGTRYINGLTTSGYVLNSDADADVTIGVSDGIVYDEDISIDIKNAAVPAQRFEQILADPAQLPVFYRQAAAGAWRKTSPTVFYFTNGVGGLINFNEWTGALWQETEASNGYHVAYWIVATSHLENPVVAVMGQRQDNNLANAIDNNVLADMDWGSFPFQESKILYRVILQTGSAFGGTRKVKVQEVTDYRSLSTLATGGFVPIDHSSLGGLTTSGHPADVIATDTTNFDGILSAANTTAQSALETIDQRIFTGATPPAAPFDGQLFYDTTSGDNALYIYDLSRTSWLSTSEFALGWGHDSGDGELLRAFGISIAAVGTGMLIPKDCTVKRISGRQRSGANPKRFDILINGASVFNFNLVANVYKNNTANIQVSEDDYLWIEVDSVGAAALDVSVVLWLAWRN